MNLPLPAEQWPLFRKLVQMTVEVQGHGCGAGVVISHSGLILTAAHVVPNARLAYYVRRCRLEKNWTITCIGRRRCDIIFRDKKADIAILKMRKPLKILTVATLGDSDILKPGENIFRVGRDKVPLWSGHLISSNKHDNGLPYLEVSMLTSPGASGGPIFDSDGALLGICTRYQSNAELPGIAYCVPLHVIAQHLFHRKNIASLMDPKEKI